MLHTGSTTMPAIPLFSRILRAFYAAFGMLLLILSSGERGLAQDAIAEWDRLTSETVRLVNEGELALAEKSAREALSFSKQNLANPSLELATAHNNLGSVLSFRQKYEDALPEHKVALSLRRQLVSESDPLISTSLENLADTYRRMGRYREAVPHFSEALQHHVARLGETSPQLILPLRSLAYALNFKEDRSEDETRQAFDLYSRIIDLRDQAGIELDEGFLTDLENAGRFAGDLGLHAQAKLHQERHIEAATAFYGSAHATTAYGYSNLAGTLSLLQDHSGAENAFTKAIEISTLAEGRLSAATAVYHYRFGDYLEARGDYERAERAYRETLDIERQIFGEAHAETINSYNTLGLLLYNSGKVSAAEKLLRRAQELAGEVHGTDSLWYATTTDNLALAIAGLGNPKAAIPLHRQALEIRQRQLGRNDADTSRTINNLALALQSSGEDTQAETLFREALEIDRATLAANDYAVAIALRNLAGTLETKRDMPSLMEAAPMYAEALSIARANYPSTHPNIAYSIHSFANVVMRVDRLARGTPFKEQSGTLMAQTADLYREAIEILSAPINRDSLQDNTAIFQTATVQMLLVSGENAREAFVAAQWPLQSAASKAIAATSLRVSSGDDALGQLVRLQQDRTEEHAQLNQRILQSLSVRDAAAISTLRGQLSRLETEIDELSATITTRFPAYSEYRGGEPANADQVAELLDDDEALVLINPGFVQDSGDEIEGSVFVIDASGKVSSALLEAGDGLQQDAEKLFCSLQDSAGNCDSPQTGSENTRGAFSLDEGPAPSSAPAFDLGLAHSIYQRMFSPIAGALEDKRSLIIVSADEALVALPFQLLLTQAHDVDDAQIRYRDVPWLVRKWAISVSTSVSAFKASRAQPNRIADENKKPFLGFGDPIIGASASIDCNTAAPIQVASYSRGIVDVDTRSLFSPAAAGSVPIADVNAVRRLARLPDTRCELESIASSLGSGDLFLNAEATETQVKDMNALKVLSEYEIISFATHGLMAGETDLSEPALVLTPPREGSIQDDGLLTASEVAALEIDADWVLLSACNTAAGTIETDTGERVSESFSGLARAFFYAGAKSLLVSHWPVQSEAAVRLTTRTFEILRERPEMKRARAFQLAILSVIDDPNATNRTTHPNYWAPFTLLGDSR